MEQSSHVGLVILCFFGALVCYLDRVGFPLAFTAIANAAGLDKYSQGTIHSAFYNGYTFSQVPGGYAATVLGGKKVLIGAFVLWTLLSITMSTDVSYSTTSIYISRMLIGAAMGFIFPTMHTVLAQATPTRVRSRCVATATSGMYFGGALAMVATPLVITQYGAGMVPKLVGWLGIAWLGVVVLVGKLPSAGSHVAADQDQLLPGGEPRLRSTTRVPWARLLVNQHVAAIICCNFTFHFAFFIILSWMPTFTDQRLGVSVGEVGGAVQGLPHLIMFASSNVSGVCGDYLIQRRRFDVGRARKLLNTAGFASTALAMFFLPYAGSLASAVFLSSMALGGLGFCRGGFAVNHIDIAPKLAGIIMGVSNTAGSVAGMIGPRLVGWILDRYTEGDKVSLWGWQWAFFLPGFTSIAGFVCFEFLATGDRVFE